MKNTVLIILALIIGFASCKKDEDNEPQENKDDLLCKEWKVNKEFINGIENEYLLEQYYKFNKDGTGVSELHISEIIKTSLQWQWIDNMENIEIIKLNENKTTTDWTRYNILKLTQDELIFEVDYGSDIIKLLLINK